MRFRKDKNEAPEATVEEKPTPYEIGLNGTIDDYYAAERAVSEDIEASKAAYEKYKRRPVGSCNKFDRLKEVYREAQMAPHQIHQQFYWGACKAFLEGRPDNIQHILSAPEKFFFSKDQKEKDFVWNAFFTLLVESADPDTVPGLVLSVAKITEDEKQEILGCALLKVVDGGFANVETLVSALLITGADAGYQSNHALAIALHVDIPAGVAGLLLDHGANLDEALQTMRNKRGYYGATPEKIETMQRKDVEIRALKETVAELTTRLENNGAAPAPAPAKMAARLKI